MSSLLPGNCNSLANRVYDSTGKGFAKMKLLLNANTILIEVIQVTDRGGEIVI